MLAADKLQLQSAVKQQATALKEKEFNLHHENLMTVGTQAAVLAGLDVTMFIEFVPAEDSEWSPTLFFVPRCLKFFYYTAIVSAFCANILVVAQTSLLSVMGASLALRGPDGSMMTATDGLYEERQSVFATFAYGLGLTMFCVLICVWLALPWEAALVCMLITMYTLMKMRKNYERIYKLFNFDESETVDFSDLFSVLRPSISSKRKTSKKSLSPDLHQNESDSSVSDRHISSRGARQRKTRRSLDIDYSMESSSESDIRHKRKANEVRPLMTV